MTCFLAAFVTIIGCVIAVPQLSDNIQSYHVETPGGPTYQVRSSNSGFNIQTSGAVRGINSQSASHSSSLAKQFQAGSEFGFQNNDGLRASPAAEHYSQSTPLGVNSQSEFDRQSAITSSKSSGTQIHAQNVPDQNSFTSAPFNPVSGTNQNSATESSHNNYYLRSQFNGHGSSLHSPSFAAPSTVVQSDVSQLKPFVSSYTSDIQSSQSAFSSKNGVGEPSSAISNQDTSKFISQSTSLASQPGRLYTAGVYNVGDLSSLNNAENTESFIDYGTSGATISEGLRSRNYVSGDQAHRLRQFGFNTNTGNINGAQSGSGYMHPPSVKTVQNLAKNSGSHSMHDSQTGNEFNGQLSVQKTSVSDFGNQAGLGSQFGSGFVTHSVVSPTTKASTNFGSQSVGSFGSQSSQVAGASGFDRKSNTGSLLRSTFSNYQPAPVGSIIENTQLLGSSNFGRKTKSEKGSSSEQSVVSSSDAQNSYVSQADFGAQTGSTFAINSPGTFGMDSAAHKTDSPSVFGGQQEQLINSGSVGTISSQSAFSKAPISGFGSRATHKSSAGSNAQFKGGSQSNFGTQSGSKSSHVFPSVLEFQTVGSRKSPVGFVTQTGHGSQTGFGSQSSSPLNVHSGSTVTGQSNSVHKFGFGGHSGSINGQQSAFAHNSEGGFGTKSVHQATGSQFGSTFNAHGSQSGSTFRDHTAGSGLNWQRSNRNQSPSGVQSIVAISNQATKSQNFGKSVGIQPAHDGLSTISQAGSSFGTQSTGVTSSESVTSQKYTSGSNSHLAQGAQTSGIISEHTGSVHDSAGFGAHETYGTQSHTKLGTQSSSVSGNQSGKVGFGGLSNYGVQSGSAFGTQSSSIASSQSTTSQKINNGLNSQLSQGAQSSSIVGGHSGIIHSSDVVGTRASHGPQFNSKSETQSTGINGSQSTTAGFGAQSNHGFQSRSALSPQFTNIFHGNSEGTDQGSINRAAGDASFRNLRGSALYNSHILSQFQDQTHDGSKFTYGYETEDGTTVNGAGNIINIGTEAESQQVTGSYSYIGDDGKTYTVNYTADDDGFHPHGSHIPQMSAEIARSIEYNLAHPEEDFQDDSQHKISEKKIKHH